MRGLIILYSLLITALSVGQNSAVQVNNGNELYQQKKYTKAENSYRKAAKNPEYSSMATYNKATAIYKQNQVNEAQMAFQKVAQTAQSKAEKHKALHNLGNTYMKQKKYKEAVEAYKNALRNNPNDEQTRYNYALAKKMMEQNKDKNDKNNKDDKNDQDKDKKDNKDDQNKDKNEGDNNKDKGDQNKDKKQNNQDKGDQDKDKNEGDRESKGDPKSEGKQQNQSKQQMENMLKALDKKEREVRNRLMQGEQGKGGEEKGEVLGNGSTKDW